MHHKKNVEFAYLLWEDFVYQVEHKDAKKSNEMYYHRFTNLIINFFMTKDPSIPRRNKVNWHYVRDDQMFMTIKLVSRHQNTQQFCAMLPVEFTNKDIRNSAAYKEYYAIALGAAPPKTKASVRKMQSSSDTTMPPPTAVGTRLSTSAKWKQPAKSSKAKGLSVLSEVALIEAEQIKLATKKSMQQTHISQASGSGADEGTGIIPGVPDVDDDQEDDNEQDDDDQDDNDDDQDLNNDGDDFVPPKLNDDESHGMNVGGDKGPDVEDDDEELYRDVNINLEGRDSSSISSQFVMSMLNPSPDTCIDSLFESTHRVDVPVSTIVVPVLVTAPTLPLSSIPIMSQVQQAPVPSPKIAPSSFLQDLLNFGSLFGFDHRLNTLEANFSEFMQTNQFAGAVSSIHGIVDRYIDHQMNEAVKVAVQIQSDRLRDEAQAENEDFLNKLDENIQKIIKEQVKDQVKVQVSKILPKIKKIVNEQLEAEVLNRSSNSSKTSYAVAADLSKLELKKILIEKMESNKSIHRSDEERNLYKSLVDAYECDKIILDTYGDTVTFKRRRDNKDKDKEPSAGSDRGSKRRRAGKEPESTSTLKEKESKTSDKYTKGSKSHQKTASESILAEEPIQTTKDLKEPSHQDIQPWIRDLAKQADSRTSFNELMDTPADFLAFLMNRLKVDTLTPELLAGPSYELMKGSCKSLVELEFFLEEVYKATTDQLDWNNPEG
uniref:Uncharacterized protein n=1 Tax=Tanacetum cinerariifolium TaxID=118510 RepID=A0A699JCI9_TANCI|nr:hypothetical protein [Tanacetum cinerariifolium]